MKPALPIWKRVLFSVSIFALFLVALEGLLALSPRLAMLAHGVMNRGDADDAVVVMCAGDSVTYGLNLDIQRSYPWQLADDLAARGYGGTSVMMAARPGAKSTQLNIEVRPWLLGLPANQRPVVYVMLGHNDFFMWDPDLNRGAFDGIQAPADPSDGLRISRVLVWLRRNAEGTPTRLFMEPDHIQQLVANMQAARDLVREHDGQMFVLTYVVPGAPPPGLSTLSAQLIRESHLGQPVINALLREVAQDLDLEVLDLERLIDTGETWNTTWWLDNIHLTAHGLDAVAAQVETHLTSRGLVARTR